LLAKGSILKRFLLVNSGTMRTMNETCKIRMSESTQTNGEKGQHVFAYSRMLRLTDKFERTIGVEI
jgi:hypothetical protein